MLSSALAISEYRKLNLDGQIGIIINLTPSYPRSNSKEDLEASNIADLILNEAVDNSYGVTKDDMSLIVCKLILNKN